MLRWSTLLLLPALLLLSRLGIDPADLTRIAPDRPPAPTFAEYVPVVSAAVTAGTRRVYGSYWNRLTDHWGQRRLDEPTPTEIKSLAEQVRANVLVRRNAILVFLSIEIMLNAVNLTLVALSRAVGNLDGQVVVFFVITVAAAEAAVGLAIILAMFRRRETVDVARFDLLRG